MCLMYYNQLTNSFNLQTAPLLKVHNGVTLNMDRGKVTALILLDLSAAFDTIDHNILTETLNSPELVFILLN